MSQWTHVIGVVQTHSVTQEEAENTFGVPQTWNDMWNKTERYFRHMRSDIKIPAGSEGTLVWHLQDTIENEEFIVVGEGSIISIEGDLRDFGECDEEVQKIANWFINGCKKLSVRWATLSIEVEYGASYMIDIHWGNCSIHKVDRDKTLAIADLKAYGKDE